MNNIINDIEKTFKKNVESVYNLMNFDRVLVNHCLGLFKSYSNNLKKIKINSPSYNPVKIIQSLEYIQENDSLRPQYQTIFNQCLVLLVSYFSSAVSEIFKSCLIYSNSNNLLREEIKISIGELKLLDFNLSENFGELVATKKDISFQDMQSILRAFETYFEYKTEKNKDINNIILSQACRHVIVHKGGVVDEKLIKQVSSAEPRDVKDNLNINENIQFSPDEIEIIGKSMIEYINKLCQGLNENINNNSIIF